MSFQLNKYFVMGTVNCHREDPLRILKEVLEAGVTMFQLREKGEGALVGEAYKTFAKSCQQLCQQYNVPFLINDDVDLAIELGADGIHIGQDDIALASVRHQVAGNIIGVSVHTIEQLDEAVAGGADYVGIGPIFQTKSKADAIQSSLSFLQHARRRHPTFPIVAIGGITSGNSQLVREAGANGVAVISEIVESTDRKATIMKL